MCTKPVPPEATWGSVEHRKHMELAKLPETKNQVVVAFKHLHRHRARLSSVAASTFKNSLGVSCGPLAVASSSALSAPPPAAVVSPCCVRGEVWNAAPVAAHCRLSLWYVRVDTEVHSFVPRVQQFDPVEREIASGSPGLRGSPR